MAEIERFISDGLAIWTPLHLAAGKGNIDTVRALMNAGSVVNAAAPGIKVGDPSITPLDIAMREQNEEIAELLRNAGALPGTDLMENVATYLKVSTENILHSSDDAEIYRP